MTKRVTCHRRQCTLAAPAGVPPVDRRVQPAVGESSVAPNGNGRGEAIALQTRTRHEPGTMNLLFASSRLHFRRELHRGSLSVALLFFCSFCVLHSFSDSVVQVTLQTERYSLLVSEPTVSGLWISRRETEEMANFQIATARPGEMKAGRAEEGYARLYAFHNGHGEWFGIIFFLEDSTPNVHRASSETRLEVDDTHLLIVVITPVVYNLCVDRLLQYSRPITGEFMVHTIRIFRTSWCRDKRNLGELRLQRGIKEKVLKSTGLTKSRFSFALNPHYRQIDFCTLSEPTNKHCRSMTVYELRQRNTISF